MKFEFFLSISGFHEGFYNSYVIPQAIGCAHRMEGGLGQKMVLWSLEYEIPIRLIHWLMVHKLCHELRFRESF